MLNFDRMDMDLSIVKEECLDDYGQNAGNILDNFVTESDYNELSVPTVPCGDDDDVNVDWLSLFDKPILETMSGLNPPLTDISSTLSTDSITNLTSINGSSDSLSLGSFSTFTESFINGVPCSERTQSPIDIPTMHKNNPFLSQTKTDLNEIDVKTEDLENNINVENKLNEDNLGNKDESLNGKLLGKTESLNGKLVLKTEMKNQQKVLLFMNTPENRAKLVGKNFNIINTSLLTKLSSQAQRNHGNEKVLQAQRNEKGLNRNEKGLNIISLKRPLEVNNVKDKMTSMNSKQEFSRDDKISEECSNTMLKNIPQTRLSSIIQSNLFQGLTRNDKELNQEIDSGYESPTSSGGSSPSSPPTTLECTNACDTIQYIDVPPHERQPFYLSEEEKKTLIMEGLPVPTGLPLTKNEERALKKVRRKIKNKISAQESRRKKKEYMESLEKKVDDYISDNDGLKKKINSLETANRSLITQVQKLQGIVASKIGSNVTGSNVTLASKCIQTEDTAM